MAIPYQIKRTSVSGRAANTTTLVNPGELGLNMTDGIMYSTNGSVIFAIGANNVNVQTTGNNTIGSANVSLTSGVTTTTGTSAQTIDTFPITFRSAKYLTSIKNNSANGYQLSELLILFDDTNASITEYGQVASNSILGTFSALANSTVISLVFTPTPANTTVKFSRTLVPI